MKVIGIGGAAGAGKSTVASRLVEHGYFAIDFAGPLKTMLRQLGLTNEQLYGAEKELPTSLLGGKTPRWAMQSLGTEWGRKMIFGDLWVETWKRNLAAASQWWPARQGYVAADLRFQNEVDAIHALGGQVWRVIRPATALAPGAAHESEAMDYTGVDVVITNYGTLEDLWRKVDELL